MAEPSPTTTSQKTLNRKRFLNIIYFVDADKTRSFKFSLNKVRLVLLGFGLFTVGSIGSFVYLGYMHKLKSETEERTKNFLATIFNYQSRSDLVYERAYPSMKKTIPPAQRPKEKPPEIAKKEPEKPKKSLAAKALPPKPVLTPKEQLPEIVKPNFSRQGTDLVTNFAIKNRISPRKIDGYVWGVAKFVGETGEVKLVSSPETVRLSSEGLVRNPRSGLKYTIRRFRPLVIKFEKPEINQTGRFSEIEITVMDAQGNRNTGRYAVSERVYPKIFAKTAAEPEPTTPQQIEASPSPAADSSGTNEGI